MKLHIPVVKGLLFLDFIGCITCVLLRTEAQGQNVASQSKTSGSNRASSSIFSDKMHISNSPNLNKVGLRVLAEGGVKYADSNYGFANLGLVNALMQPEVRQVFVLRNDSNAPISGLRLQHALPAGLQILASLSGQKRAAPLPLTVDTILPALPPRQTLTLFVSLSLVGRPGGNLSETVLFTMPAQSHPVAAVEMRAELVPLVTFSTPAINFGRIPAGQSRAVPLNLTLNPRLAPLGSVPRLYCSNPDVRIVPVPVQEKDKRHSPLLSKEQQAEGLYAYRLTLPADTPVGSLSGTLRVVIIAPPPPPSSLAPLKTNTSKIPLPPLAPDVVAQALRTAVVPITGQIVGDVSATPVTVTFGTVMQGKAATQQVQVLVKDSKLWEGMQISSTAPWLSARLLPSEPALNPPAALGRASTKALELLLSPEAPVGKLQTQLLLRFSNGQQLRLPISIVVTKLAKTAFIR